MKRLLNGYVLVKKPTETNTDGLQFAQALDSFIYMGEVVQVDEEHQSKISVGDTVYFLKHAGESIPVNGQDMKFIKMEDLISIK